MNRCASRCIGSSAPQRPDHQDRQDQQIVDLELQLGDGEIEADGEHGADQRLLQVGRVLRAEDARCVSFAAMCAPRRSNTPANRSARPMARIGLMPISASVNLAERWRTSCRRSLASGARAGPARRTTNRHGHGDDGDHQQLPRQQAEDRSRTPATCRNEASRLARTSKHWPAASASGPMANASRPTGWRTK